MVSKRKGISSLHEAGGQEAGGQSLSSLRYPLDRYINILNVYRLLMPIGMEDSHFEMTEQIKNNIKAFYKATTNKSIPENWVYVEKDTLQLPEDQYRDILKANMILYKNEKIIKVFYEVRRLSKDFFIIFNGLRRSYSEEFIISKIYENVPRMFSDKTLGVKFDKSTWKKAAVFDFLQEEGNVTEKEMFQVFNMGIGYMMVVEKENADKAISILNKHHTASVIGEITKTGSIEIN